MESSWETITSNKKLIFTSYWKGSVLWSGTVVQSKHFLQHLTKKRWGINHWQRFSGQRFVKLSRTLQNEVDLYQECSKFCISGEHLHCNPFHICVMTKHIILHIVIWAMMKHLHYTTHCYKCNDETQFIPHCYM